MWQQQKNDLAEKFTRKSGYLLCSTLVTSFQSWTSWTETYKGNIWQSNRQMIKLRLLELSLSCGKGYWKRRMFQCLLNFMNTTSWTCVPQTEFCELMIQHLDALHDSFNNYFPPEFDGSEWVQNPFGNVGDVVQDEDLAAKSEFIDIQGIKFWRHNGKETHLANSGLLNLKFTQFFLKEHWVHIIVPFATTYRCECGFYTLVSIMAYYIKADIVLMSHLKCVAFYQLPH